MTTFHIVACVLVIYAADLAVCGLDDPSTYKPRFPVGEIGVGKSRSTYTGPVRDDPPGDYYVTTELDKLPHSTSTGVNGNDKEQGANRNTYKPRFPVGSVGVGKSRSTYTGPVRDDPPGEYYLSREFDKLQNKKLPTTNTEDSDSSSSSSSSPSLEV